MSPTITFKHSPSLEGTYNWKTFHYLLRVVTFRVYLDLEKLKWKKKIWKVVFFPLFGLRNTTKKKLNCDGKFLELWRKISICDGALSSQINLWRVRHNFLWRKYSVTKFLWRKLWQTFSITKKFVTEIVTESPSQFPEVELPRKSYFVTNWVMSVTKL